MKNQSLTITPNQLQQATQELSKANLGKFEIPNEIQTAEKDYYVVIGINSKLSKGGLDVVATAKTVFYDRSQWNRMQREINSKDPMFTIVGAGQFKKVVILHNPTLPLTVEKKEAPLIEHDGTIEGDVFETTGRLTDTKKETVNKLMEEGKGTDDFGLNQIAEDINAPFVKVKEYIKSFNN